MTLDLREQCAKGIHDMLFENGDMELEGIKVPLYTCWHPTAKVCHTTLTDFVFGGDLVLYRDYKKLEKPVEIAGIERVVWYYDPHESMSPLRCPLR